MKAISEYGIANAQQALQKARRGGWSVSQIKTLLEACYRHSVGQIRAYGPGAVYWQLTEGEPGSPIRVNPSEGYRRAVRDRDRQRELARQAERSAPRPAIARGRHPLESSLGEVLDGLGRQETEELIGLAQLGLEERRWACREASAGPGERFGIMRGKLLETLEKQGVENP